MSTSYETLILEAGGPGARLLQPGRAQRALALGAGLAAEDVGMIIPLSRGRVSVEIRAGLASRLATPRAIPFQAAGQAAVFTLRRQDDPPSEELADVELSWSDGGPAPTPGELASALPAALGSPLGAEELGAAWVGAGWMRLTLPAPALLSEELPATVALGARTLALTHRGKKKP